MNTPIITFQWKDYTISVYSIDNDDGFVFSAIDYCGEEYNERMSSREEYNLYNYTIEKLEQMSNP